MVKWTQIHLLLPETRQIVPDIEQHCTEQFCIPDPKVVTNPLTESDILYTNADQLVNKMDDLSTLIAGEEPDLILITEILPKRCVNSLSAARLALDGYTNPFLTLILTLNRPHKACAVLEFMFPTNYQYLKSHLMGTLTMNMSGFQLNSWAKTNS